MNIVVLLPLFLVILGLAWGLWLIFRNKDMVTQPTKMVGYFVGALLALGVAGVLTVIIFPAWANQLLGLATSSPSVKNFQQQTESLLKESMGQPPAPTARPGQPSPTTSPVATPAGSTSRQSVGQTMHVVVAGDTLYSIARKYGVTPKSIQDANPNQIPDPNNIKVGAKFIIPKP